MISDLTLQELELARQEVREKVKEIFRCFGELEF